MTILLRIIRGLIILLGIPGLLITLYAAAATIALLWAEFFPDPADIGHGMAHAFLPMVVWTVLGLGYLWGFRCCGCWSARCWLPASGNCETPDTVDQAT